jgi:peptidoglycan-associated lipoprotein
MLNGFTRTTFHAGLGLIALFAIAAMPGCSKKAVVAKTPSTPAPTVAGNTNTGSSNRSVERPTASTTSGSTSGSNGITSADRNTLNKSLAKLDDALFDYNQSTIRPDAAKVLETDVAVIRTILNTYPSQKVKIEGHADERGSDEYNIALGDKRGEAAREFLTGMGISKSQLDVISYGKQRPVCTDHTEDCWQKNRRAHFVAEGNTP